MFFVGGRGSLIVGGGGEASVGAFVGFHEGENADQGLFGTSFDAGLFGSVGAGVGFEASLSAEAGLVDELSGVALNANASILFLGGSAIGDPSDENLACTDGSFGDFLSTLFGGGGGSVGLGVGAPAGGSVTVTGTGTTTDLGRAIGRAVGLLD